MTTYGSVAGAQALLPTVGPLTATTVPTDGAVTVWLGEAYAKINRAIGNAGYGTPIGSSAALYTELTGLENLYAAAYALRALSIDIASGDGEDRSEVWLADFYGQLRDLSLSNLALLGASPLASSTPTRRRRIGTLQMRKIDGYSRGNTDRWQPTQAEYTGPTAPSE